MLLTALLFVPCARRYQGRTHLQSSTPQQQGQGASTPEHDSAANGHRLPRRRLRPWYKRRKAVGSDS